MKTKRQQRIVIEMATAADREAIYRIRHEVFARELGQHHEREDGRLTDALDERNVYVVARSRGRVVGFVSVTPPAFIGDAKREARGEGDPDPSKTQGRACGCGSEKCGTRAPHYSVEKYVGRDAFPFAFDGGLYEVRLLTVVGRRRGSRVAGLLMYAAFRWVESHGGTRIVAIGRREVLGLYEKVGLKRLGRTITSGAVTYELMSESVDTLRAHLNRLAKLTPKIVRAARWRLNIPLHPLIFPGAAAGAGLMETIEPIAECFHGGAFFDAIGVEFDDLSRREHIINADVLDAWFPPSPRVIAALTEHLPWLLRTSPPTRSEGMSAAIARARGVDAANILPGAGSSDLIFLTLRQWLRPSSRVLILDPSYGEYAHLLEKVIRCRVDRLTLRREVGFAVDLDQLESGVQRGYDLVVLINPNNPTGRHVPRGEMERVLRGAPPQTRVWVDETYTDYIGPGESIERFAAASTNVVVCKSLSKVLALSGVRAAYLCGPERLLAPLRPLTPPWAVSLPGQVAVVEALKDESYYRACYAKTRELRAELAAGLVNLGIHEPDNTALQRFEAFGNFVLCYLPASVSGSAAVVEACRSRGVFIRDVGSMGTSLGSHALRIAVKDATVQRRVLNVLAEVLDTSKTRGAGA